MKVLVCVLMVLSMVRMSTSQVIRVPVGSDSILYTPQYIKIVYQSCSRGLDTCSYQFIEVYRTNHYPLFPQAPFGWNLFSPFNVNPTVVGKYVDTFTFTWTHVYSPSCSDCKLSMNEVRNFDVESYFDSTVKLRVHKNNGLFFRPDSNGLNYLPASPSPIIEVQVFNNINDPLFCDKFSLDVGTESKLSVIASTDSIILQNTIVNPLSFKTLRFHFVTSASVFLDTMRFLGVLHTHIKNHSIDSMITIPISFVFNPKLKSNVIKTLQLPAVLYIHPNPAIGLLYVSYSSQYTGYLHLNVFNELGKDVMTVFDGMMNDLHRDFSFKLPPGMYYVRMETAEGVVTKKVIVE